jgi:hypothetical protein
MVPSVFTPVSTSIQLSNPTKIQRLFNVDGQLKFNVVSTLMCLLGYCQNRCKNRRYHPARTNVDATFIQR